MTEKAIDQSGTPYAGGLDAGVKSNHLIAYEQVSARLVPLTVV